MRKFAIAMAAIFLLTAQAGAARGQDFRTGLHAFEAGDFATAFGNWWPLAIKGDARSQASLGLLYYSGKGAPLDYSKALLWFSRAAEAGQPTAQFFMGLLYYYGRGVKKDLGMAHAWCDIAVTYGYMDSLFCRDAIEIEMSPADKIVSDAFTSQFNATHAFRN